VTTSGFSAHGRRACVTGPLQCHSISQKPTLAVSGGACPTGHGRGHSPSRPLNFLLAVGAGNFSRQRRPLGEASGIWREIKSNVVARRCLSGPRRADSGEQALQQILGSRKVAPAISTFGVDCRFGPGTPPGIKGDLPHPKVAITITAAPRQRDSTSCVAFGTSQLPHQSVSFGTHTNTVSGQVAILRLTTSSSSTCLHRDESVVIGSGVNPVPSC